MRERRSNTGASAVEPLERKCSVTDHDDREQRRKTFSILTHIQQIIVAKLQGRLSRFDLSNKTLEEIQADLVKYLDDASKSGDDVEAIIDEQLWLQVEDDAARESLEYRFIELEARRLNHSDHTAAIQQIADYILEKQTEGMLVWEQKGRSLLEAYIAK